MSVKRPVGRPRKPDPFPPPIDKAAIDAFLAANPMPPNITDETRAQNKIYFEEYRRTKVSELARATFPEGRSIANEDRKRAADAKTIQAIEKNGDLIRNVHLSVDGVIKQMTRRGTTCGAGRDRLRVMITAERRKFTGPD